MSSTTLGQRLREWRLAQGLTQGELAERAGLDQSSISAIETGRIQHPRIDYLHRLASTLGIGQTEMLEAAGLPPVTVTHVAGSDLFEFVEKRADLRARLERIKLALGADRYQSWKAQVERSWGITLDGYLTIAEQSLDQTA